MPIYGILEAQEFAMREMDREREAYMTGRGIPTGALKPGEFLVTWWAGAGQIGGPIKIIANNELEARAIFDDANPALAIAAVDGVSINTPGADPVVGTTPRTIESVASTMPLDEQVKAADSSKVKVAVVLGLLLGAAFVFGR